MKTKLITLVCCLFILQAGFAETLVNKIWQDTTGHPNLTFTLVVGEKDNSGNKYLLGNTYRTGENENLLITKYNSSGNKVWQVEYNSVTANKDFGFDMFLRGSYLYVTGISWDSVTNNSDYLTLKINASNGNIVWTKTYGGTYNGYDAAASIKVDNSDNVYITGTEQKGATDFRMRTIKYNSSGTVLWTAIYDSTNFYDGAVGITATATGVVATGFSGSGFGSWDFVTATYNRTTGALQSVKRSANGNGSFSKPAGLVKDVFDNIYIVGSSAVSGSNTDIKLIKYDSLANEIWVRKWGSTDSLADEPMAFVQDSTQQLLVTGYTTKPNGGRDIITLRYDKNGNLLWYRTCPAPDPTKIAEGLDITSDMYSNVYVCGRIFNGNDYDYITLCYDKNGVLKWQKQFDFGSGINDEARDIVATNQGEVYVSGISKGSSVTTYLTIAYAQYDKERVAVFDTAGNPRYMKNQVIVRFAKNALKNAAINNRDIVYGSPSDFLTSTAYNSIKSKLGSSFDDCRLVKIFPELTEGDSLTTTRRGNVIRTPDFYTAYLIVSSKDINERKYCDSLNHTFPLVRYAHKNYIAIAQSNPPNDPEYTAGHQNSLVDVSYSGSINVEPAWDLETGKPFVRVGVFGAAIDGKHRDLGGSANGFLNGKVQGWDFQTNTDIQLFQATQAFAAYNHHENKMAGIIGAIRNNNLGVAGIAGGDLDSDNNLGVSLFSARVGDTYSGWIDAATNSRAFYYTALLEDSIHGKYSQFGLHIINFSYCYFSDQSPPLGQVDTSILLDYDNITLLRDAIHSINRLNVVMVASRGQQSSSILTYPACYEDSWVLNVGGSDISGELYHGISSPNFGGDIDIIAPYSAVLIKTTDYNGATDSSIYVSTDGTSAAAAHTTGVSSLLLSYLGDPNPNSRNLAHEDIEYILEATANPTVNNNDPYYIGSGRLNAGDALNYVDKSERRIIHVTNGGNFTSNDTVYIIDTGLVIKLLQPLTYYSTDSNFHAPTPWVYMDTGTYKVDVYKYSGWFQNNITANDTIISYWPVHSASMTYGKLSDTLGIRKLLPFEKCYIDSMTRDSALVSGYFYKIKDAINDTLIRWLPYEISSAGEPTITYSLLLKNVVYATTPVIKEPTIRASLFPNPTYNESVLQLETTVNEKMVIKLFDVTGRLLSILYEGNVSGVLNIPISTASYASGIYVVNLLVNGGARNIRLIKLQK